MERIVFSIIETMNLMIVASCQERAGSAIPTKAKYSSQGVQ